MGNSSIKSPSLNSEYSDSFTGLTYRSASNLIVCQQIFSNSGEISKTQYRLQASNIMNAYSTMNDTQKDTKFFKKESCILQNIKNAFGTVTNAVSKITNYMFNINNTLSLMPNEVMIFPEYLIQNLTRTKEHSLRHMEASTNILESVKNEILQDKLHLIEMGFFDAQQMKCTSSGKLIDAHNTYFNTWVNSVYATENNFKLHSNAIDTFNSEKLTYHLNNIKNLCYRKINNVMPNDRTPDYLTRDVKLQIRRKISKINDNLLCTEITTTKSDESPDMKMPTKNTMPVKMWRKHNFILRSRSKGRGKLQLRKSGVSQLKHRKEKLKQNLDYNNQDDIDIWVEEKQILSETFMNNCISSTSTMKLSLSVKPKFNLKTENNIFNNPMQSTKDYLNSTCNIQSRPSPDSSIDSDDSCSIIFDDETELDCTDFGCKWSSSEETENDDNIDHSNHRVRFILEPAIHVMIKWDFAYRAARRGPWEEIARDRERFRGRINCVSKVLNPILLLQHRERIYQNRFITCN